MPFSGYAAAFLLNDGKYQKRKLQKPQHDGCKGIVGLVCITLLQAKAKIMKSRIRILGKTEWQENMKYPQVFMTIFRLWARP